MNIDIITLSCARNYGAMLQTYALYKYLINCGHKARVIDYITERYNFDSENYEEKTIGQHKIWGRNAFTRMIWRNTYLKAAKKAKIVFREFLETNVELTKTYYSNQELQNEVEHPDMYITGSDQIWNSDFSWDKKIDFPYFLGFAPDHVRKVSYASSFGKSKLLDGEKSDVHNLLKRFNALSVREQSGKEILESIGLNADVVADPTLLLSRDEWSDIAADRMVEKPYILLFQIKPNSDYIKYAKYLAKKMNKELIILCPDYMNYLSVGRKAVYLPKVAEWISYFKYADYVLTDSFHATVFSTIFEKPFRTAMFAGYNTRITGYLDILGLDERAITMKQVQDKEILEKDINYTAVTERRNQFIKYSKDWLMNHI